MTRLYRDHKASWIAGIYLLLGVLWIFFSDHLLLLALPGMTSVEDLSRLQTWKGWFYVIVTALIIFWLSRTALQSQEKAYDQLRETSDRLLDSQQKITHLLDASPAILYALKISDNSITTTLVSNSVSRILGYSHEEVMADDWWEKNLHPDDRESALQATERLIVQGQADHEYRFLTKTGQVMWVRDTARTIKDSEGRISEVIGSWIDVSEKHLKEQARRLYSTVFDNIGEGMLVTDLSLTILSVNKAAQQIFGYTEAQFIGRTPALLKSGHHDTFFYARLHESLQQSGHWHGEIWNKCSNGALKPLWVSISAIPDASGRPYRYVAIYSDISELKRTEAELQFLAHHDPLTGLPNRTLLADRLQHALLQSHRLKQRIAVLFIDLDDFKNVNDSMGHTVGDELLQAVAARLQSRLRAEDTLARLGGDEFVILAEQVNSADDAAVIAGSMIDILRSPFRLSSNLDVYVEACIGIALYPENNGDPETLLRFADTAMYRAKQQGRSTYCFYTEEMSLRVTAQLDMETALRQALEREELLLHYQPKTDLVTGRITGLEALIRWARHPGKLISPADFIPIAEKSGLIVPIGTWVIREACRQIREWQQQGIDPVNVAVNISVKQFRTRDQDLHRMVLGAIDEFGVAPGQLSLEITESALMENPMEVAPILHALKKAGISIALDDFGTGFSNLSYLSQLPLDALKIDASFVRGIGVDINSESLVRSVIDLAQNLNLRTVAEGVETEVQQRFLREHQCHEMQGYLFSQPLQKEDCTLLLSGSKD